MKIPNHSDQFSVPSVPAFDDGPALSVPGPPNPYQPGPRPTARNRHGQRGITIPIRFFKKIRLKDLRAQLSRAGIFLIRTRATNKIPSIPGSLALPTAPAGSFPPTDSPPRRRKTRSVKQGFIFRTLPQPVFLDICCCIVAKCGLFRAQTGCRIAIQRLKRPFPEIRMPLFTEKLSVGPPGRAIGG